MVYNRRMRDKAINLQLTADEREAIKAAARAADLPAQIWLRHTIKAAIEAQRAKVQP